MPAVSLSLPLMLASSATLLSVQLLPPPRDSDIRTAYWEIRTESEVWLTLKPVSEAEGGGGSSTEARGISPLVWAGIAAVLVIGAIYLVVRRRRVSDEEI